MVSYAVKVPTRASFEGVPTPPGFDPLGSTKLSGEEWGEGEVALYYGFVDIVESVGPVGVHLARLTVNPIEGDQEFFFVLVYEDGVMDTEMETPEDLVKSWKIEGAPVDTSGLPWLAAVEQLAATH